VLAKPSIVPNKWLQEVEESAQRSDRMAWSVSPYIISHICQIVLSNAACYDPLFLRNYLLRIYRMLLGGALTIGHEIDLYEDSGDTNANIATEGIDLTYSAYILLRRRRLKRLLFVYISQLASRMGLSIPKTPFHTSISSMLSGLDTTQDGQWHSHMKSWVELTRLVRTSSEFLFPSKAVTRELVKSGRYSEFLEHFRPLLEQWLEKYLAIPSMCPRTSNACSLNV